MNQCGISAEWRIGIRVAAMRLSLRRSHQDVLRGSRGKLVFGGVRRRQAITFSKKSFGGDGVGRGGGVDHVRSGTGAITAPPMNIQNVAAARRSRRYCPRAAGGLGQMATFRGWLVGRFCPFPFRTGRFT